MVTQWVTNIGPYPVEKQEGPRPGGQAYIPLDAPTAFVLHTTEGSTVDSAVSTIRSKYEAPHFVVGEGRVVQMRPLTAEGATLRAHNDIGWQVEMVGFSQTKPWLPPVSSLSPLIALARFARDTLGVPLVRPSGWLDDCSDIKTIWASNNTRRQSNKALGFHGWVGHLDVPDQDPTNHYDPGAFRYTEFFDLIGQGDADVTGDELLKGVSAYLQGGPAPADGPALKMYRALLQKEGGTTGLTKNQADVLYAAKPHAHDVTGKAK